QKFCQGVQVLDVFGHHFHHHDDGHADQHAPDAPEPATEEQRHEDRHGIHLCDAAGHPGGHEHADHGGDDNVDADHNRHHGEGLELQEGGHTRAGGGHERTDIGDQVQYPGRDGPGAGVV